MDSKRRMVELHIWEHSFFSELNQTEKLFYWFVICKCDNVGVYQHNPKLAAFHCEGEIDLDHFINIINAEGEKIAVIAENTLWLKDFVRDTWGTISAGNNLGTSCYKLLVKHGILERFISEYPNAINIKSFREAITEEKLNLPLPVPENSVSREYEGQTSPRLDPEQGQGRGKAGTININNSINEGINGNKSISKKNNVDYKDNGNSFF